LLLLLLLRLHVYHCVQLNAARPACVYGITLRLLVPNNLSSSPVKNKRRRLPATSVIYLPRSVAAECIALSGQTVHRPRCRQILAENREFYLPHLHSMPPLGGSPSEYCHKVWCGKTRMVWPPDGKINWRYVYLFQQSLRM